MTFDNCCRWTSQDESWFFRNRNEICLCFNAIAKLFSVLDFRSESMRFSILLCRFIFFVRLRANDTWNGEKLFLTIFISRTRIDVDFMRSLKEPERKIDQALIQMRKVRNEKEKKIFSFDYFYAVCICYYFSIIKWFDGSVSLDSVDWTDTHRNSNVEF